MSVVFSSSAVEPQTPAPQLAVQRASRYRAGRDRSSAWTNAALWEQREAERSNHFHAQPLPVPTAACSSTPSWCLKSTCHPLYSICQHDTLQIDAWVAVSRSRQAWEASHWLLLLRELCSEQKQGLPSAVGGSQPDTPAPAQEAPTGIVRVQALVSFALLYFPATLCLSPCLWHMDEWMLPAWLGSSAAKCCSHCIGARERRPAPRQSARGCAFLRWRPTADPLLKALQHSLGMDLMEELKGSAQSDLLVSAGHGGPTAR